MASTVAMEIRRERGLEQDAREHKRKILSCANLSSSIYVYVCMLICAELVGDEF